jgi:hypothetical protein
MSRALAATACLLLSLSGRLLAQPTTTSDREPPASPAPDTALKSPLAEPSPCTVRTCLLTLEERIVSHVLTRGLPGKEIGRISLFSYPDFEVAMASSPAALEALRGVNRSRTASLFTGPAVFLAGLGAAYVADQRGVQYESATGFAIVGVVLTGGAIELWGDLTWFPRLQRAIRIYNESLPSDLPD